MGERDHQGSVVINTQLLFSALTLSYICSLISRITFMYESPWISSLALLVHCPLSSSILYQQLLAVFHICVNVHNFAADMGL